ncbi:HAD family hydrolase [Neokomagataea tanensis]|uniref:D,D-heptose 1,7-bisphosphate phosphatase n=1 Tax=Neokomagataea tanensis TaxID=661191 RepID=A0A4Y6V779_9PROT|nr:HAD family hydrolase [Neokomagataea tanensis]
MVPPSTPAAFLDRDGVLNVDVGYPHRLEDFQAINGAVEAVSSLNTLGYKVIVVSNQSGVARGYFGEDAVLGFNHHLQKYYAQHGAVIDHFYYCPFHPQGSVDAYSQEHDDRKPNAGMIEKAIREHNISREKSFLIGDKKTDILAAQKAKISGFLFNEENLFDFLKNLPL